jgi:hypothetical protein
MKSLTVEDFAVSDLHASLFIAYSSICKQMGDIAEAQRRRSLTHSHRQRLEDALFRWLKELPPQLRITHSHNGTWSAAPYSSEARQLVVPYFTSLMLLYRSSEVHDPGSTICLVASSYILTIFEEFLSRDQLRYLGPVFTFYALAAGLVQLAAYRYESLQSIAEHEFNVVKVALEELGKRWGSADGALRGLTRARDAIRQQPRIPGRPPPLSSAMTVFFTDFGPELCRLWNVGFGTSSDQANTANSVGPQRLEAWDYTTSSSNGSKMPNHLPTPTLDPKAPLGSIPTPHDWDMANIYPWGNEDVDLLAGSMAPLEGFWVLEDLQF